MSSLLCFSYECAIFCNFFFYFCIYRNIENQFLMVPVPRFIVLAVTSFFTAVSAVSQEASGWTLQSCIDYALENNNDIQLSKVDKQVADVELK